MNVNENKLKRQLLSVKRWIDSDYNGIIHAAPRYGKMFLCVYKDGGAISTYLNEFPNERVIIITASPVVRREWLSEIDKHIPELRDNIDIYGVQELAINSNKIPIITYGLRIVDEVDECSSSLRSFIINTTGEYTNNGKSLKSKHHLYLTASIWILKKAANWIFSEVPIVDTISYKEAEDNGFICKSIEYNLMLKLTNAESTLYDTYTNNISNLNKLSKLHSILPFTNTFLKVFMNSSVSASTHSNKVDKLSHFAKNRLVLTLCTKGGLTLVNNKPTYQSADVFISMLSKLNGYVSEPLTDIQKVKNEIFHPDKLKADIGVILHGLSERELLMKNNNQKLEVGYETLKALDFPNTITFSESSEFSERFFTYLNSRYKKEYNVDYNIAVIYHSKAKIQAIDKVGNPVFWKSGKKIGLPKYMGVDKLMKYNIDTLDNTPAKILVGVKSLSRGFTKKDIELILTFSYTESKTQYYQARARGVALNDEDEGKQLMVINLVFEDTIEVRKVIARQATIKDVVNIKWIDSNYLKKEEV